MYLNSIRPNVVVEGGMYARNVVNDERQHASSTLITNILGTNFRTRDTIEITESSCVGNVIVRSIESISMRLSQNRSY